VFDGVLDATSQGKQRYHLLTESIREADIVASRLGATINKKGIVDLPRDLAAPDFVKALVEGGVRIDSWSPEKKSLEEAYLELTGTRRA
jgi:ABC-2 type transport system ATP-binding protein